MKALLAASALMLAVSAPAFAQDLGTMQGNPNASDRPAQRGLSSEDLVTDPKVDGAATGSILPPNSVDGTTSAPPAVSDPALNTGGANQGSGINPGVGSSGSTVNQGAATGGGNSAY